MENVEKDVMKAGEVADRLGFDGVTLRKYCYALESFGYEFQKNGRNREYTARDLEIVASMKFLVNKGLTREVAAETVLNKYGVLNNDQTLQEVTPSNPSDNNNLVPVERYNKRLDVIEHNVEQLPEKKYIDDKFEQQKEEFKKEISDFFAQKVVDTLEQREKNRRIQDSLTASREFAAAVEEETTKKIENMGFFEKLGLLFGKKRS